MRAHIFDMDGTLLHGTTAPLLLAAALRRPDALAALEARFAGSDIVVEGTDLLVAYRATRAVCDGGVT